MSKLSSALYPTYRFMFGPGPTNADPRVLRMGSAPQLGHLDPEFLAIVEHTAHMLRLVFQTNNEMTLCVAGSGFSGAEAILTNLLEEGDKIIVGDLGFFSGLIAEIARRAGALPICLETQQGKPMEAATLEKAFQKHPDAKIFATAIAETSTGLFQPIEELERITHQHGALFVVDAVCGLGGVPLNVDEMKIDACYGGSQKCLGALPGLAPLTLNKRAEEVIRKRKKPVQSYYLDLEQIHRYWNGDHAYHHTPSSNSICAMHEALRLFLEEGLEARWARYALHGEALRAGIRAMGLSLLTQPGFELPVVTVINVEAGMDEAKVRATLLRTYNIEIGAGIGTLKGSVIRIGLMGHNSCRKNVDMLLSALEYVLPQCGFDPVIDVAIAAADGIYAKNPS